MLPSLPHDAQQTNPVILKYVLSPDEYLGRAHLTEVRELFDGY